jgi:hypothetical protein
MFQFTPFLVVLPLQSLTPDIAAFTLIIRLAHGREGCGDIQAWEAKEMIENRVLDADAPAALAEKKRSPSHLKRNALIILVVFALVVIVIASIPFILGFGLYSGPGLGYATPAIRVDSVTCASSNGTCTIHVTNSGLASTNLRGCTISGQAEIASPVGEAIGPSGSLTVTCQASTYRGGNAGSVISGTVLFGTSAADEFPVVFVSVWK